MPRPTCMLHGVPGWALLAGFLAAGIPALWLLLGGLNLLFRHTIISPARWACRCWACGC